MPELPEVEAVVRRLASSLPGATLRSVRILRPRATHPQTPAVLQGACGRTVESVERRGKHVVIPLSGGCALRVHLRMTGNLTVVPTHLLHSSTVRVMFALGDGRGLAFEDPRALGRINLCDAGELERWTTELGMDPLAPEFTPAFLIEAARRSRKPVKSFLMDQTPIAGLGNIYTAESLFEARLHPASVTSTISAEKLTQLHTAIRNVLTKAIPEALASYSQPGSHEGMQWSVYDREGEPCTRCGSAVSRMKQASRSTYYCSSCQIPDFDDDTD